MLPVANHLPLTFESRGRSRLARRARRAGRDILEGFLIATVVIAVAYAIAHLASTL